MRSEIQRLAEVDIGSVDLVRQAIFAVPVHEFEATHGVKFEDGLDDLDACSALYLRIGSQTAAFIHHKAQPAGSMTLYLDRELSRNEADKLINKITRLYHYDQAVITWRESDNLKKRSA